MKAGGALVLTADVREAASRAVGEAGTSLGGLSPSFAVLFASAHFFGSAQDLVTAVAEETGQIPLIGCVAEAVGGQNFPHAFTASIALFPDVAPQGPEPRPGKPGWQRTIAGQRAHRRRPLG